MEILVSNKGKDMIGYDGNLYRKDKSRTYTINWTCVKEGCRGRLTTSLDYQEQLRNNEIPVETGDHADPPDPAGIQVKKIENRVTQLATRNAPSLQPFRCGARLRKSSIPYMTTLLNLDAMLG